MGKIAKKLTDTEYKVDCVSPSPVFAQQTRALLREKSEVFECYYEQLQTKNRYDLVLFSESLQYIEPEKAMKKTLPLLNRNGYLLICDLFRVDTKEKCPIAGGHNLTKFFNIVSEYPLSLVKNFDITEEMSPNIDIEHHIFKEVVEPVANLLGQLLDSRYPLLSKILKWKYKRKIEKMRQKYFSSQRTAENFKKFKSYRLLLYKKKQNKQHAS